MQTHIKSVEILGVRTISLGDEINGRKIGWIYIFGNNILAFDKGIKRNSSGLVPKRSFSEGLIYEISNCTNYIVTKDTEDRLIKCGLLIVETI